MSSDEDEMQALSARNLARVGEEINEKKKAHPDMFVSGWDDPNADVGVDEEKNPHETPQKEILWAAENGMIDIVRSLLEKDPELVNQTDNDKYTPLHRACYNDHVDVVNLLISYGASVSAKTKMGWEPLHSACHWNNPDCIERLIAAGANVNARSDGDQTPLHIASSTGYCEQMLQILLFHPDIDAFVVNKSGDLPRDIAKRTGLYEHLFDLADPDICYIKSPEFTMNPFRRDNNDKQK